MSRPKTKLQLRWIFESELLDYDEFKRLKSSATFKPATDIKPTNTNDPTSAAGMPPDMPAATDEPPEAEGAGMMAGAALAGAPVGK